MNAIDPAPQDEVEELAKSVLEKQAYDYISGGAPVLHSTPTACGANCGHISPSAGSERRATVHINTAAFSHLQLLPRMLRDVSHIDLCVLRV